MNCRTLVLFVFMLGVLPCLAQTSNEPLPYQEESPETYSVMREQAEMYRHFEPPAEDQSDPVMLQVANSFTRYARPTNCKLKKAVYGFHPYWMNEKEYLGYDYSLLTEFCYFGIELNPITGALGSMRNWDKSNAVFLAQQAGCRLELCITNFGGWNNYKFFSNQKAWATFANQLKKALDLRNADGVNLNFEDIYKRDRQKLTQFITYLYKYLQTQRPGTYITMTIPAANPYNTYDLNAMNPYIEKFVIMGYDYHTSRSKHAGAIAPLNGEYSLQTSIKEYVESGINPSMFILALPYYGREWKTQSSHVPAPAKDKPQTMPYSTIIQQYRTAKPRWHAASASPYIIHYDKGEISQCWYDSKFSLSKKYDLALQQNLGGVGIWALGYDKGCTELWKLLEEKFVDCNVKEKPKQTQNPWLEYYINK